MPWLLAVALILVTASPGGAEPRPGGAEPRPSFDAWLAELRAEARERGYREEILEQALSGLTPLPGVIASDRRQAERTLTFEEYLRRRVTDVAVERGRALASEHQALLAQLRLAYGVPGEVLVAIWGLESGYGRNAGSVPVFQALATLAWDPRRARFFRAQLYDALTMVDRGYIDAPSMLGSWAGAMGQPQFMPSSYLAYAVDLDGDGRRDIWTSVGDTLASIANYLRGNGWRPDEPWGREVSVGTKRGPGPAARETGCIAMREMTVARSTAEWRRHGVQALDGAALDGPDASLVRAGDRRFLVHANYEAILRYNCAHHYALSVGILADRIGAAH